MTASESDRNPVEKLAEEFAERYRRGERPSLTEFVDQYPEWAEDIRDLFPALVKMEQLKPAPADGTGPYGANIGGGPTPDRVGDYRILREVGRGGMGVVYEAEQLSLGRHVALKVLPTVGLINPVFLERFRREAKAAARLHHTNIVPVFGVGESDGLHYYAMQFIQGDGLDKVLHDLRRFRAGPAPAGPDPTRTVGNMTGSVAEGLWTGRFVRNDDLLPTPGTDTTPPSAGHQSAAETSSRSELSSRSTAEYFRSVAQVGMQVAEALAYAHKQGILHRDIKPSNLLLDQQGAIWVTDFGLAKAEGADELTHTGDIVGTLRFMAPERFDGTSLPQSDVYGLGLTLYEMLALRPAFEDANRARLIERILHDAPAPPRKHDPRIPRDLETIVLKAIAKDPADRYATAEKMAEDLQRFLSDRPIRARRASVTERLWRWCRRNPAVASLTAAVLLLLVVIAIGSSVAAVRLRTALGRSETAERQARLELGGSLLHQGAANQRSGLTGQRFDSLDLLGRAVQELRADPQGRAQLPEVRDQVITALGLTDLRRLWEHEIAPGQAVSFDPQLERYAVTDKSTGELLVFHINGHKELFRIPRPDVSFWHYFSGFSPDGQYLVVMYALRANENLSQVWRLETRTRVAELRSTCWPAFHPNSRSLLYAPTASEVALWDLNEKRETRRISTRGTINSMALDRTGKRLAVGHHLGEPVQLFDLEASREIRSFQSPNSGGGAVSWSADGQLLAVCRAETKSNYNVDVWHVTRGELTSVLQGHSGIVVGCQFAYDGNLLATTSWDGTTKLWDAASGDLLVSMQGQFCSFSADDRKLAYCDATKIGVCDIAGGAERKTLHPETIGNRSELTVPGQVVDATFSPDGRLLAVAALGHLCLYRADTGQELAKIQAGNYESVLFHPDGQILITCGSSGLYRWPIRPDADAGSDALMIGPPELVHDPDETGEWGRTNWLPGNRALAVIENSRARVLLVDLANRTSTRGRTGILLSGGIRNMTSIAVSPDGQWAAAGARKERRICLWNVPKHRLERVALSKSTNGESLETVKFSPDGRWLVSCLNDAGTASGYHFSHVGTWEEDLFIPKLDQAGWAAPAFTGDGRLMAMSITPQTILLADGATGRPVAHLTTLQPLCATPLAFSPDGTRLVASTNRQSVLLWDLRQVRQRLAELNLDWGEDEPAPAIPAADKAPAPPLSVRVIGEVHEPTARRKAEIALLTVRLIQNPFDADAYARRGQLFLQGKQGAAALADLEVALRLRPDHADVERLRAKAFEQIGNARAALAALDKYVQSAPDDRDSRLQRGLMALSLGQPEQAADDFTQVLIADPEWGPVRLRRVQAYIVLGRHADALADLNRLLESYPEDPSLYQLRGTVHAALDQPEQARADRAKAFALQPNDPESLNDIAWQYVTGPIAQRDPVRALPLIRKAVELRPSEAILQNTLGVVLYRNGDFVPAIDSLKKSLDLGHGQSDGFDLFFLAMCHKKLGDAAQAKDCFDRAVLWTQQRQDKLPAEWAKDLAAFRAEAESVLKGP